MHAEIQSPERRQYFRVNPSIKNPVLTTFRREDIHLKSLPVKDISLGGVAFYYPESENYLPVGTMIHNLQLNLPKHGPINASGVIRRIDTDQRTDRLICALEFTRMPTSSDRKLYTYLNERQREIQWFSRN